MVLVSQCSALILVYLAGEVIAQGTWASVPITGPERLTDGSSGTFPWHYAEVQVGKPPQNHSLQINIFGTLSYIYGPECLFCPGERVFDPALSDTFNDTNTPWSTASPSLLGSSATETLGFGGVLEAEMVRLVIVNYESKKYVFRINEGVLSLFVHPTNATINQGSILHELSSNGKLLYPVIGLKLGGKRRRLTVGALDPTDYEGQINWVEAVPTRTAFSAIPIDGLRGHQGNSLPYVGRGALAALDTMAKNIYIPPLAYSSYFLNRSLIGPQEIINIFPDGQMAIGCNYTLINLNSSSANAPFSVDINGINYPVDHDDMVRPRSLISTNTTCKTALQITTSESTDTAVVLGLSFLRSVFLAYRFPTPDCPKAFYGFAFPRGARSNPLLQTPRSTPADSKRCLLDQIAAHKPVSTPTPTKPFEFPVRTLDSNVRPPLPGERTYKVYGQPDHPEVVLKDVDGVPFLEVREAGGDNAYGDGAF